MSDAPRSELEVLLIEDNEGDARLIERYLERADTDVLGSSVELRHATTLSAGLTTLEETDADAVLLDLGLPGSSGLETLERVLEHAPDRPIVVLTGLDDRDTAAAAIRQGAQDYLVKDTLDGDVLVRALRHALERKANERELKRQNRRLERFASVVSHDLRNPLQAAMAQLSVVRREHDNEHLENVAEMHERMEALIGDMLTLARQGRSISDPAPVSIERVARDAWNAVASGSATVRYAEGAPEIQADEDRLRELFENLFRNAIEHAGADVTVTVGPLEDADGFYVADDGPGIPPDEHDDVFEYGYTTDDDGTGFGLNIVREIADAHGWEVAVTDADDGGARFEFVDQRI